MELLLQKKNCGQAAACRALTIQRASRRHASAPRSHQAAAAQVCPGTISAMLTPKPCPCATWLPCSMSARRHVGSQRDSSPRPVAHKNTAQATELREILVCAQQGAGRSAFCEQACGSIWGRASGSGCQAIRPLSPKCVGFQWGSRSQPVAHNTTAHAANLRIF